MFGVWTPEMHREQVWRIPPGAGAAPEWHGASVLKLGCLLSLFQKKYTLRQTFFKAVSLWLRIEAYLQLIHLRAGFFCWLWRWDSSFWPSEPIFLLLILVAFFVLQNIHAYILLKSSGNFLRGIGSDKALNIAMFLTAGVLTARLSNHGLLFSSSLLLIFFDESTFSIILWKLSNQLSCRKGRMRKITTARGRGDAFNSLLNVLWFGYFEEAVASLLHCRVAWLI